MIFFLGSNSSLYIYIHTHTHTHTKKTVLLQRAKTAAKAQKTTAKGPFDLSCRVLLWRFYPPMLRCRNRAIAAVTKNTSINAPFGGIFGFLWRVENRRHMRLEFVSIDFSGEQKAPL